MRPLWFSSGAAPEAPALLPVTHRYDAVFTIEVAQQPKAYWRKFHRLVFDFAPAL